MHETKNTCVQYYVEGVKSRSKFCEGSEGMTIIINN